MSDAASVKLNSASASRESRQRFAALPTFVLAAKPEGFVIFVLWSGYAAVAVFKRRGECKRGDFRGGAARLKRLVLPPMSSGRSYHRIYINPVVNG